MPALTGLRRRGTLLAFATAAAILATLAAMVVTNARTFTADNAWVAHTYAVLAKLEALQTVRFRTITSQRNYLLSSDESFALQFSDGKAEIAVRLHELRDLVSNHPAHGQQVRQISDLLGKRMQNATRVVLTVDREGLAAAQQLMAHNGSRALDADIDRLVGKFRAEQSLLLTESIARSEARFAQLELVALLAVPLCLLIVGVSFRLLNVENRQRRQSELAVQAANLELQGTLAHARQLSTDMKGLSQFAGMLQSCTDLPELMYIASQMLALLNPPVAGTIYLIRPSRDRAEVGAQWNQHRALSHELAAIDDCWAVRSSQPHYCDNLLTGVKCAHVELPPPSRQTATACLPLSAQGELSGWLYLSGTAPGPLPGIELMVQAAEQLSLALANIRLRETLRLQSIRDPLTGLYNRRYLEESLAREISRSQRRQLPMVVLMLDIDHFKAFNEIHGHPGGDALLAAFGQLLQSSCRLEDIPCRYGGEEFTLILPEAEASVGLDRARSLLSATAQLVVAHNGLTLPRVTVSIGLATLPRDGNNASSLIEAADLALYRAKSQGRNQVQQAAEPPSA